MKCYHVFVYPADSDMYDMFFDDFEDLVGTVIELSLAGVSFLVSMPDPAFHKPNNNWSLFTRRDSSL